MAREILISFIGTLLALLSAGFVWVLKVAYEKHKMEMFALAKFERIFANDITILKDNFDFVDEWISAAGQQRCYNCHFGSYYINEDDTYKISNLELINKILSINHKLRRTELDINNVYKSFWESVLKIDSIQDKAEKEKNLNIYFINLRGTLEKMKSNYKPLQNDLVDTMSLIRCSHKVRFHSLFGYFDLMLIDVFPKINKSNIEKEIAILKDNIARNQG